VTGKASKEKLRQWKLTDDQINKIESSGVIQTVTDVISNTGGIVTDLLVSTGDYVTQGTPLFKISDLSRVWILFDAYESDLQFLGKGEKISFTIQAFPGKDFSGTIAFIDPVIDPLTRVAKVRVETGNQSGKLKPEMFATGIVAISLNEYRNNMIIPKTAVLWTGKRSIVYVKQPGDEPVFKLREIGLGPMLGESYVVTDGLTEGEEIVTSGTFSVDAAAQLEGKPSMMNQPAPGMDGIKENRFVTFEVSGNCEMCKDRIEKASKSVKGVLSAKWDINTKKIQVEYNATISSLNEIQKAIADSGHDNVNYRAPDDVYNKLPECCLYRK